MFDDLGKGVLDNAWKGYNCSLFAYGQTGSGKSYSVMGYGKNQGIVPMFCDELFKGVEEKRINAGENEEYQVQKACNVKHLLSWVEFEFIGVLRHMQRYFSHNIYDGTDVQADWRSCTYGRAPNVIDILQGSLTCLSYTDTGPPFLCLLRSIAAHRDHFVRRLSVCACVCLSDSHTFLIVTHSYVSQATHAFLGMLPLCLYGDSDTPPN